ncbi:MAG TPA: formyltransferase family protein [Steroidobacteraceae bacterium]|nr:formyltransferase family protein [Steroidobacteraceae bacterium]
MRFAVTVTDRYLNVFQTLVEHGWTPVKVFTGKVDNRIHRNTAVIDYARKLNVDTQISRLTEENLRDLGDKGCDALVVASYEWRVPEWRAFLPYAVNFHPAPLPHGRGPYPMPAAILESAATWGVSCHKIEPEIDRGDILKTLEFPLSAAEDHDSLDLKIQLAARRLAADVADHFRDYWDAATAQVGGSYYPKWSDDERTLDFSQTVEQILRRVRAFGCIECLARLNNTVFFVHRAVGWTESHRLRPGTVVQADNLSLVVAAADGYIGLTEWSLINPDAMTGTFRR